MAASCGSRACSAKARTSRSRCHCPENKVGSETTFADAHPAAGGLAKVVSDPTFFPDAHRASAGLAKVVSDPTFQPQAWRKSSLTLLFSRRDGCTAPAA